MKKLAFTLAILMLVGVGCITIREPGEEQANEPTNAAENTVDAATQDLADQLNQIMLESCRETAGTYDDATKVCTCPVADTLDVDSGECLTADGTRDGIRGQAERERLAKVIACNESGGGFVAATETCVCPTDKVLGEDNKCGTQAVPADSGTTASDVGTAADDTSTDTGTVADSGEENLNDPNPSGN